MEGVTHWLHKNHWAALIAVLTLLAIVVVAGALEATASSPSTQQVTRNALSRVVKKFTRPASVSCRGAAYDYSGPVVIRVATPVNQPTVDVVVSFTFTYRTGPNQGSVFLTRFNENDNFVAMRRYRLARTRAGTSTTIQWVKQDLRAAGARYSFNFTADLAREGCRRGFTTRATTITAVAEVWS
jgi:hypothetical protein